MIYRSLHNRWLRLITAVFGTLLSAVAVNVFIVPLGLYTGGLMGLCPVIRTLLAQQGIVFAGVDLTGILYFIFNMPILLIAWKGLGKKLVLNTAVCTVASSIFFSIVPVPATPVIEDMLTSALLGGIIAGIAGGVVLTCGCSGGGLDVIGLYLSKKGKGFSVGKFSLSFNFVLYAACMFLFLPEVVIYSVIYNVFSAIVLDRVHQQNVTVQVLIFTKDEDPDLPRFIMERLGRGVTYWTGRGAYTEEATRVLCVCLSKYEIDELRREVHEIDPRAFFIIQEGVEVGGNFARKIGDGS